jgi:mono/diheme cytochrome c family protein
VTGKVVDETGRGIAGAVVRVQSTSAMATADGSGAFVLEVPSGLVPISAWAPGFFVGGGEEHHGGADIELVLIALPEGDYADYEWISAHDARGKEGGACAACHSREGTDLAIALPADEWDRDAHGTAAHNVLFLTMYGGSDINGNRSPPTRYRTNPDYGRVPLRPDPGEPYYGPGYVLDFPDTAGNCGSCHTPMASADDAYGVDPRFVTGAAADGVGCDFCHKVSDVVVSTEGLPWPGRPGVLSIELARPPSGHQFFAGPFDDVAPGEDTFSPLQLESRFCAACHHAIFWDTVVYDSYGEWLRSDYSDPDTGQTCQNCHMPPSGATLFALPAEGGRERDPATIASHLMPGASDEALLRSALTMIVDIDRGDGQLDVEVTLRNDNTGHHVPTDSPLRHVILLVTVTDDSGEPLELQAGPTLPDWCGVGDPADGYYAGLPGTAYAKVLEELWTEVSPTGSYWNPTRVLSDNRIAAHDADTTNYSFRSPTGRAEVEVRLIFRRAFIEFADQKGWELTDIVMADFAESL